MVIRGMVIFVLTTLQGSIAGIGQNGVPVHMCCHVVSWSLFHGKNAYIADADIKFTKSA